MVACDDSSADLAGGTSGDSFTRPPLVFVAPLMCFTLLSSAAHAQQCDNPTLNTAAHAACETARFEIVREKVQKEYQTIAANINPFQQRLFRINQETWIAYVDTQCELDGDLIMGSAGAWMTPKCKADAYEQRLTYFQNMPVPMPVQAK